MKKYIYCLVAIILLTGCSFNKTKSMTYEI